MEKKMSWLSHQNRLKVLGLSLGLTLGSSMMLVGQGCVTAGQ